MTESTSVGTVDSDRIGCATNPRGAASIRAIAASTHPLSPRVPTSAGPLPRNHVFAVVGADARSGHVLLRNPVRPEQVLTLDARSFRRGFLSLDVTAPLR